MKIFGKDGAFEWAGIPCLVWTGVFVLILNHLVYPFAAAWWPWLKPVNLPSDYWTALGWIICGLFGKKGAEKFAGLGAHARDDEAKKPANMVPQNDCSDKAPDPEGEDGHGN